ncbi:GTPase Era [Thermodesulfobacteriota bacterium]
MSFLSGFIAIVGPPNAGKSTLMNRILGTKVAIVSPRPQTTRNRILGIHHGEGFQMIFMDTPGIHRSKTMLHKSMVESALSTVNEVDIILLIIEVARHDHPETLSVLKNLKGIKKPCVLAINKIDQKPKEKLLSIIAEYDQRHPFASIIPISALTGDGVTNLIGELKRHLRSGPEFFPREMKTDQSETFLTSELIREKLFQHLKKEVPYSCAVTVEDFAESADENILTIAALIHVEAEGQKGIVIGKKGQMIKAIGTSARRELENLFNIKVHLDLTVGVEKNWSKNSRALRRLGY